MRMLMRMWFLRVLAAPALLAAMASPAAAAARQRIAVYDLKSIDALRPVARSATDAILVHLGLNKELSVIGQAEIAVLLSHAKDKNDLADCAGGERETCLAKLTEAVEADRVITGRVGRWGDGYFVALSLSDAKKAATIRGESCTFDKVDLLEEQIAKTVDRLLSVETQPKEAIDLEIGKKEIKIAVLPLANYDAGNDLTQNLTQLLALELKRLDRVSVISRDEVMTMLHYESEKQIASCKSDVACLVEIGGALGVRFLVSGGVGRVEDTWVIHLKLMDIEKAEVANRVSETFHGPPTELAQAIRFSVRDLVGLRGQGKGAVSIAASVDDASVLIDARSASNLREKSAFDALEVGKHGLVLDAPGYQRLYQEFYVEEGLTTKLRPELIALPKPWYEEWWPWAIIGSAVAAGVTATVVLETRSPATGTVHVMLQH